MAIIMRYFHLLVVHPLELRHGRQDGEVCDGELVPGHKGLRRQEALQVVQGRLERVGLLLVARVAGHQDRVLEKGGGTLGTGITQPLISIVRVLFPTGGENGMMIKKYQITNNHCFEGIVIL